MIKVAIVEDIKDIREGIQQLIDSQESFSCTDVYASAEDAIENIHHSMPDVVLMDIHLPGISGVEAVQILKLKFPNMQFIMSTIYKDDTNIFESLKAGASGYILKKTPVEKIIESIQEVYNGGSPMSTQIARRVINSFRKLNTDAPGQNLSPLLTPKENEILQALANGLRYKEIADQMQISINTVFTHVRRMYEKLQVQSRTDAVNKVFGKFTK